MQITVATVSTGNGPTSEPVEYDIRPLIGDTGAGHCPAPIAPIDLSSDIAVTAKLLNTKNSNNSLSISSKIKVFKQRNKKGTKDFWIDGNTLSQ